MLKDSAHLPKVLSATAAVIFIGVYLVLALLRISYPFQLEWMEGGSVEHVARILAGKPLYVEPSLEFVPYIYPPLYYYVSALLAQVTGVGFFPLRLVSLIASVGVLSMIFSWVKRETDSGFWGLISAGLFAATFAATGGWFDIARVDMLFLFFLLAALFLIRFHKALLPAMLLMILAFFTKQQAVFFMFGLLPFLGKRKAIQASLLFGLPAIVITLLLQWKTEGWYAFYVFELPGKHPWLWKMLPGFWSEYVLDSMPFAVLGVVVFFFEKKNRFYMGLVLAALASSWISMMHAGGYQNNLVPLFAALTILFPLGIKTIPIHTNQSRLLIHISIWIQFAMLLYQPWKYVPTSEDHQAGKQWVEEVQALEGNTWFFTDGYLPVMANKPPNAQCWALIDVLRANNNPSAQKLEQQIRQPIASGKYDYILMAFPFFQEDLLLQYELEKEFFPAEVFNPVSGAPFRPNYLYKKKEQK